MFLEKSRKAERQNGEWKIDISHLQAGIYFVKIKTDLGEEVRKVVKL